MRMVISTAALIATALLAFAAPTASGAEPERRAAPKKCLWKARDCYPPARLWYRVSVSLQAEQNANLDKLPTETFSGETQRDKLTERWTFRSIHAIRLTLLCDDASETQRPFLAKRRIDGKRKTVGGCANPRRGFRPTLRFAATAAGEVMSMVSTQTFGPSEVVNPGGDVIRCEGHEASTTLVSSQPLDGTISTPDSQTTGLVIDAAAAAPFATLHSVQTAYTCEHHGTSTPSPPSTSPQIEGDGRFQHTDVIGGDLREGIFASKVALWFPLNTFLRFTARPANFGGDYIIQKRVTQPQLAPGTFFPPPPGLAGNTSAKDYTYTIRLEPCPNKGREVRRC